MFICFRIEPFNTPFANNRTIICLFGRSASRLSESIEGYTYTHDCIVPFVLFAGRAATLGCAGGVNAHRGGIYSSLNELG